MAHAWRSLLAPNSDRTKFNRRSGGRHGRVYRGTPVWRAKRDQGLPEAFARDAARLQRFEHEARVLSTVNHPNILTIHDVGAQGDLHSLVSELLEGQTCVKR